MSRATAQVIGLCLATFAAQLLVLFLMGGNAMVGLFALSMPIEFQPWTLATSVYAHSGVAHLLGNLAMFALLGVVLERHSTTTRFHAFVLVTGALAGLSQIWISGLVFGTNAQVLGLSGAVFACMGYVVTGNRLSGGVLESLDVPAWGQLLIFAVLAAIVTWLTASPGVALIGHFTGFLLGLMAGQENMLRVGGAKPSPASKHTETGSAFRK